MEAIRTFQKVKDHRVVMTLPTHFEGKEVEIIVLPRRKKAVKKSTQKEKFLALLRACPIWSDTEVAAFETTIREGYKNWKIQEF